MATPPLQIWVNIHTYNTYGGHATISLVGQYLQLDLPSLGSGLKEIDVHVYFQNAGEPKSTLESLFDRYAGFIKGLPSLKFFRKKGRIEVSFLSELGTADIVSGYSPPRFELFVASAREIVQHVSEIRSKLKAADDFDVPTFLSHLEKKAGALPTTEQQFQELQKQLKEQSRIERESMDEWERLGIDWEDFHPSSRTVLDSPFFWNCADDFAPNGNDTGADILALYQEAPPRERRPGKHFLQQTMREWGMSDTPEESDKVATETLEDSQIGLAFAQLKCEASCEEAVRDGALEAIARRRERIRRDHPNWNLLAERLDTLGQMERKLRSLAAPTQI